MPRPRRRVALSTLPDVSEPAPNVTVAGVVAEELMFAGRRSDPVAARRWLEESGARELAAVPLARTSTPPTRVRVLSNSRCSAEGVEGLVLVSPDRHGGDPHEWWSLAQEFAARGLRRAGDRGPGVGHCAPRRRATGLEATPSESAAAATDRGARRARARGACAREESPP